MLWFALVSVVAVEGLSGMDIVICTVRRRDLNGIGFRNNGRVGGGTNVLWKTRWSAIVARFLASERIEQIVPHCF